MATLVNYQCKSVIKLIPVTRRLLSYPFSVEPMHIIIGFTSQQIMWTCLGLFVPFLVTTVHTVTDWFLCLCPILFFHFFSFCLFLFASKRIITFFKNMSFNDLSSRMFGGLCPVLTEFSLEYLLRCFSRLKYKFFEFIVAFEILRVSLLHNIQFL